MATKYRIWVYTENGGDPMVQATGFEDLIRALVNVENMEIAAKPSVKLQRQNENGEWVDVDV